MEKSKAYVKLRLKLAKEKLSSANILHEHGNYRDAVSRAYYCIYYAAKALLLHHGQDPYTHKGVAVLFHKFCKVHNSPSASFAKMLSFMLKARIDADYEEEASVTRQNSQEAIAMAETFLQEMRKLIKAGLS